MQEIHVHAFCTTFTGHKEHDKHGCTLQVIRNSTQHGSTLQVIRNTTRHGCTLQVIRNSTSDVH